MPRLSPDRPVLYSNIDQAFDRIIRIMSQHIPPSQWKSKPGHEYTPFIDLPPKDMEDEIQDIKQSLTYLDPIEAGEYQRIFDQIKETGQRLARPCDGSKERAARNAVANRDMIKVKMWLTEIQKKRNPEQLKEKEPRIKQEDEGWEEVTISEIPEAPRSRQQEEATLGLREQEVIEISSQVSVMEIDSD